MQTNHGRSKNDMSAFLERDRDAAKLIIIEALLSTTTMIHEGDDLEAVSTETSSWQDVTVKIADLRRHKTIIQLLLRDQNIADRQIYQELYGHDNVSKKKALRFTTLCSAMRRAINGTLGAVMEGIRANMDRQL